MTDTATTAPAPTYTATAPAALLARLDAALAAHRERTTRDHARTARATVKATHTARSVGRSSTAPGTWDSTVPWSLGPREVVCESCRVVLPTGAGIGCQSPQCAPADGPQERQNGEGGTATLAGRPVA